MSYTRLNASAATLTKNRTDESRSPFSGMCVTCVDGCIGMCEIGKSAIRGSETIYPQPFGIITAAAEKDYPVDLSHFSIITGVVGAEGIAADSDKAIFPNVRVDQKYGVKKDLKVKLPFIVPGLGSTNVAKNNWEGLAAGCAISGIPLTIGENVCGMDVESEIKNGKVVNSPEMAWRIRSYTDWQQDGYGSIVLQANVEDTRLGVQEYAIRKLGVEVVELKWGQGAKNIGGEVKIKDLKKAQLLYSRGYVVLPNPTDPDVIKAFEHGAFKEFERHSRIGMVTEEGFMERVDQLRKAGAKYISLKTGAYRPLDLARALKFASKSKMDLLTVDAAGGGTGMSPWRMMNEWGIPQVELHSLLYNYCVQLDKQGEYVPDIAIAGGFTFEDQVFKGLSMGAPYFKLIGMARAPLCAAMVGKTIGRKIQEGDIPVYIERFGNDLDEIFITAASLKKELGAKKFKELPSGALGVYTYMERMSQGLRQLMCGARKFSLDHLTRNDLCALTKQAAEISGIPYVMDADRDEAYKLLKAK